MKNPRLFEAGVFSCLRAGGRRAFVFDGADGIERCREDEPEERRGGNEQGGKGGFRKDGEVHLLRRTDGCRRPRRRALQQEAEEVEGESPPCAQPQDAEDQICRGHPEERGKRGAAEAGKRCSRAERRHQLAF